MVRAKFSDKSKRPGKAAAFVQKAMRRQQPGAAKSSFKYQSKVHELEAEIALLTSYASDTIYRLNYDTMTYDYISPSVENLLGFSPDEMRCVNFRSLILETKIVTNGLKTVGSFDDLEIKRKEGDVNKWQADYLIRTKDGRQIWVSDVSHPWFDENGTIIGSIGSMRDITERVVAETRAKDELAKIANTDALTGISNRREYFTCLDRELKRIERSNEEVSMLLIDIDHFKKVNDVYGHDVGDRVLLEVVKMIETCLRDTDIVARIGGEEFAVMLPDTSSQGGYWVAERIRTTILKHDFAFGIDKSPISCSVSIGVSTAAPGEKKDSSDLYKTADVRLYIAKNTGRNQVSVDEILHMH